MNLLKSFSNFLLAAFLTIVFFSSSNIYADENLDKVTDVNLNKVSESDVKVKEVKADKSKVVKIDYSSPVGKWRTVDDKTGNVLSLMSIYEKDNIIYGQVEKVLDGTGNGKKCKNCEGLYKNKPLNGAIVMKGFIKDPNKSNVWINGEVTDPVEGKTYSSKLTVIENGKKLDVRGYILFSWIGRSQIWIREIK